MANARRRPAAAATAAPARAPTRWALAGAAVGLLAAGVAFAPAAWLAAGVARATGGQLLLADARGTIWSGDAVAVLSGGTDSRDAVALPGRLAWTVGLGGGGLELRARQACCLRSEPRLQISGTPGRWRLVLMPAADAPGGVIGRWPAAWLAGLGTPWNTLQLDGDIRLASPGLTVDSVRGRLQIGGTAVVEALQIASRLSTLPVLGSYRVQLLGAADTAAAPRVSLSTIDGALRLSGSGDWLATGLRLRGEASAAPGAEDALSNLLNIIGRRQGARSLIAIG
jgi:general secretion pathway protein N